MRHTKLVLYNRYQKTDEGKTVKEPKVNKPSRAECLHSILKEKKFKDFDSFILSSDKSYTEKNEGKESNVPETFRIWRIILPIEKLNGVEVPEFLE